MTSAIRMTSLGSISRGWSSWCVCCPCASAMAAHSAASVAQVNDTFSTPIPVKQMVRFSFLVGGGQKMRQKYDADCGKHFAASLRALGFEEDRGASEDLACQATFKHQHDTDKNVRAAAIHRRCLSPS